MSVSKSLCQCEMLKQCCSFERTVRLATQAFAVPSGDPEMAGALLVDEHCCYARSSLQFSHLACKSQFVSTKFCLMHMLAEHCLVVAMHWYVYIYMVCIHTLPFQHLEEAMLRVGQSSTSSASHCAARECGLCFCVGWIILRVVITAPRATQHVEPVRLRV